MTFNIPITGNVEEKFQKIRGIVEREGGRLIGDHNGGTLEGNTMVGIVKIKYKRNGDNYSFTKVSGSFLASENDIKREIMGYLRII